MTPIEAGRRPTGGSVALTKRSPREHLEEAVKNRRVLFWVSLLLSAVLLGSSVLIAARATKAGTQELHQYKCLSFEQKDGLPTGQVQDAVNQAAREGWRLASASSYAYQVADSSSPGGMSNRVGTLLIFEK